jgi:hypothetical protein
VSQGTKYTYGKLGPDAWSSWSGLTYDAAISACKEWAKRERGSDIVDRDQTVQDAMYACLANREQRTRKRMKCASSTH